MTIQREQTFDDLEREVQKILDGSGSSTTKIHAVKRSIQASSEPWIGTPAQCETLLTLVAKQVDIKDTQLFLALMRPAW